MGLLDDQLRKLGAVGKEIPRERAVQLAREGLAKLGPHIHHGEVVGRIPRWAGTEREHPSTHDIDLLVVPRDSLPKMPAPYNVFTSESKAFEPTLIHWLSGKGIIHLKRQAIERGWKLNRYGLHTPQGTVTKADQIYRKLGREMPEHVRSAMERWRSRKLEKSASAPEIVPSSPDHPTRMGRMSLLIRPEGGGHVFINREMEEEGPSFVSYKDLAARQLMGMFGISLEKARELVEKLRTKDRLKKEASGKVGFFHSARPDDPIRKWLDKMKGEAAEKGYNLFAVAEHRNGPGASITLSRGGGKDSAVKNVRSAHEMWERQKDAELLRKQGGARTLESLIEESKKDPWYGLGTAEKSHEVFPLHHKGRLVGYLRTGQSMKGDKTTGFVYVTPSERNKGIGTKALVEVSKKYPGLISFVHEKNAPSLRIHEKAGFSFTQKRGMGSPDTMIWKHMEKKAGEIGRIRNVTHDDVADFGRTNRSLRPDTGFERKIVRAKNGDLVGFAARDPEASELKALWVNPKYRRRGVATKLIKSFSGPVTTLDVLKRNKAAKSLYEGLGFKATGPARGGWKAHRERMEKKAGKEDSEKSLKDADFMLDSIREEALRLGMEEGTLGPINGHDLVYFEGGKGPINLLITAGAHGAEIAGPWGLYTYLASLESLPPKVRLTIIPTVNPTGIDLVSRKNRWGQAPNAGYLVGSEEKPSREGKLILAAKDFMKERSSDGHLALHEDYDRRTDFYIYSNEDGEPGRFSQALVETGNRFFDLTEDGFQPNEDRNKAKTYGGIIFQDHDGSLEDFLFHMGARHTAVTETPQRALFDDRVTCQAACIKTFVSVSREMAESARVSKAGNGLAKAASEVLFR